MDIQPMRDNVLIQALSSEQTFSGLIIPDANVNLKKGIVIAAGPGLPNSPITFKKGDIAYYQDEGIQFTYDGQQYMILTENKLLLGKIL